MRHFWIFFEFWVFHFVLFTLLYDRIKFFHLLLIPVNLLWTIMLWENILCSTIYINCYIHFKKIHVKYRRESKWQIYDIKVWKQSIVSDFCFFPSSNIRQTLVNRKHIFHHLQAFANALRGFVRVIRIFDARVGETNTSNDRYIKMLLKKRRCKSASTKNCNSSSRVCAGNENTREKKKRSTFSRRVKSFILSA